MNPIKWSALIALCLLVVHEPAATGVVRPRPLTPFPEGSAAIAHLLLHFDSESATEWVPAARALLWSLPADVKVTIAARGGAEAEMLSAQFAGVRRNAPDVLLIGATVTPWARDRVLAVGSRDEHALLLPSRDLVAEDRSDDLDAAISLAADQRWDSVATKLAFEGGDILCSSRTAFVGRDTIVRNSEPHALAKAVAAFENLLGMRVAVVGGETPPHEHLDMYLTVLDDETVVLGDPQAGRELLQRDEQAAEFPLPAFDHWTAAAQDAMAPRYEVVLRELEAAGLNVLRVPVLHGENGGVLTWNNCLVERRGGLRRVYMPVYGIPDLDETAVAAFRKAGCRVFPIDCSGIIANGGTVRCITNVVAWKNDGGDRPR